MDIDIVTKKDLADFRRQLLDDLKGFIDKANPTQNHKVLERGYKTKDVKAMLNCSTNTLNSLRIARSLRTKKVGGSLYYHPIDIQKILTDGFS